MAINLFKKKMKNEADIQNPEVAAFMKKKKSRKRKLIFAGVAAAAVVVWVLFPKNSAIPVSTQLLEKGTLTNTLNLSGVVKSKNSIKVYSGVGSTVKEINVKIGDEVREGDTLALLDTEAIELNVAISRANANTGTIGTARSLVAAQKEYDALKAGLANGTYAPILSATQGVERASKQLSDAKRDYKDHYNDIDYAEDTLNQKEKAMVQARNAMEQAAKECRAAGQHTQSHTADCLAKQEAYALARRAWAEAYNEFSDEISEFGKRVQDARLSYENALQSLESAKTDAELTLFRLETQLQTAQLSAENDVSALTLKKALMDLENCTVKAPISGRVTAIYADEGAPASGLLFIIEDTEQLIISTELREYDMASVAQNMDVIIKSDATKDKETRGIITSISPTAAKSVNGDTQTTSSVTFPAEIDVTDANSGLLIGMNVRMNVILGERENVFFVPYDAVVTNEAGESILYTVKQEGNKRIAQAHIVTTGMETDFYIEVSGETLTEGDSVITTPEQITQGVAVMDMNALPQKV